ncbi:MAG: hypothetical protein ISQ28_00940 [Alphaproteobacteria bacterium]|nr:hypothetical protein [Alphaproteobacteria bacterium]
MRSLLLMAFAVVLIGAGLYLSLGQPRLLFQPAPLMDRGMSGNAPDPDRVAALSEQLSGVSDADRQAAIEGMVAGLRQRLEQDGGSAEEWERLARSYANLQDLEGLRFALDGLLQLQPEDPRLLMLAAQAAAEAGDRVAAAVLFRRLLPLIDPDHPRYGEIRDLIEGFDTGEPAQGPE